MLTENSAAEFCNKFVDALYFSKSPFLNRGNNNEIEELIDEKAEIISIRWKQSLQGKRY
ncbi:MAG: hypothetical protein H7A37_05825 [Chlamydiales bacterium]|nr:hypothetical protein [Chlamydiales bacterium]